MERDQAETKRDETLAELHDLQRFVWLLGYDPETKTQLTRAEQHDRETPIGSPGYDIGSGRQGA